MIDDIDAYDGVHGLLWHKKNSEDRFIKVGYHEGLIDSLYTLYAAMTV